MHVILEESLPNVNRLDIVAALAAARMIQMSLRVKMILVGVLLLLTLVTTAIAANATFQAFQRFQQQKMLATRGDIRTIRPWMTIPYISRVYHVPEAYLYRSLQIHDARPPRHATLHALAFRYNRPVDELIHDIQFAIQTYREQHPNRHSLELPAQNANPARTVKGVWS